MLTFHKKNGLSMSYRMERMNLVIPWLKKGLNSNRNLILKKKGKEIIIKILIS